MEVLIGKPAINGGWMGISWRYRGHGICNFSIGNGLEMGTMAMLNYQGGNMSAVSPSSLRFTGPSDTSDTSWVTRRGLPSSAATCSMKTKTPPDGFRGEKPELILTIRRVVNLGKVRCIVGFATKNFRCQWFPEKEKHLKRWPIDIHIHLPREVARFSHWTIRSYPSSVYLCIAVTGFKRKMQLQKMNKQKVTRAEKNAKKYNWNVMDWKTPKSNFGRNEKKRLKKKTSKNISALKHRMLGPLYRSKMK